MMLAVSNPARSMPDIDVLIDSEKWAAQSLAVSVVRDAIAAAAQIKGKAGEVAVLLTDDAKIRVLNAHWRGTDSATNVLSFPAATTGTAHLGDIAIAFETVQREALAERKDFLDHLAHLAIHGYLHLLGFDHETERDAERMENLERQILAKIGIADPYAEQNTR